MNIKQSVQDSFNAYTQAVHKDLVWSGSCRSWCQWLFCVYVEGANYVFADKDNSTGTITAVWPGSSIHFMDVVETPRWEDYDIEYMNVRHFSYSIAKLG